MTNIDFILRDDDPEANEDSDNILTTRNDPAIDIDDEAFGENIVDFRESCNSETEQLAAEPHCTSSGRLTLNIRSFLPVAK